MGKSTLGEKNRFQKMFMAQPLINTKMGSQLWKDEGNAGKCERKMPNQLQMCEEMKHMGKEWNGNTFMGVFLPDNKKYDFPN